MSSINTYPMTFGWVQHPFPPKNRFRSPSNCRYVGTLAKLRSTNSKEAYEVGANAVVGVDLDYVELSKAGSMVMLVASGTAVRIEE